MLRRGAQEAVPIGILRRGFRRDHIAPRRLVGQPVAIPEGAHEMHVADHALLDQFLRLFIERRTAILRSHLDDLFRFLPRLDDVEALFDGVRQRLLDVDVLAGIERRDRHIVMQVLRRHDVDGVDRLVG